MLCRVTKRLRSLPASLLVAAVALVWTVCLAIGVLRAGPGPTQAGGTDRSAASAQSSSGSQWGDHTNAPLPEYVTGEECLFCHRDDWGNRWAKNYHQRTVRPADADAPAMKALAAEPATKHFVSDAAFLLGTRREVRFL